MNNVKSEEFDVNNLSREELNNLEIDIENDMESFEKIINQMLGIDK